MTAHSNVHTNGVTEGTSTAPGPAHRADQSPQLLEAEIARQREALAHTVHDLQAKLDVKARAHDKAAEIKDRATTDAGRPRPELVAGASAAVGVLVALLALKIRHGRNH